jgi:hypothetical protein
VASRQGIVKERRVESPWKTIKFVDAILHLYDGDPAQEMAEIILKNTGEPGKLIPHHNLHASEFMFIYILKAEEARFHPKKSR